MDEWNDILTLISLTLKLSKVSNDLNVWLKSLLDLLERAPLFRFYWQLLFGKQNKPTARRVCSCVWSDMLKGFLRISWKFTALFTSLTGKLCLGPPFKLETVGSQLYSRNIRCFDGHWRPHFHRQTAACLLDVMLCWSYLQIPFKSNKSFPVEYFGTSLFFQLLWAWEQLRCWPCWRWSSLWGHVFKTDWILWSKALSDLYWDDPFACGEDQD